MDVDERLSRSTRSPGLASSQTPTAWSIGSPTFVRPAPSRFVASPIASACMRVMYPSRGATHCSRPLTDGSSDGSSTTARAPPCRSIMRPKVSSALPEESAPSTRHSASPSFRIAAGEHERARGEALHDGREILRPLSLERLDALAHFDGVADGAPERRLHAGDERLGAHARALADATIEAASSRASDSCFMNAPSPHLTSSTTTSLPSASFLAHHRGRDERDTADGRGDVAERVQLLSAGASDAVCPMMLVPTSLSTALNSSIPRSTR